MATPESGAASRGALNSVRVAPWERYDWHGSVHSLDGSDTTMPENVGDVEALLYYGDSGDRWDGDVAGIARLKDGRLIAWETFYGPTGDGFCDDAYGGDADVWFAKPENLPKLVLQALTDQGRVLCGIPREGLPDAS